MKNQNLHLCQPPILKTAGYGPKKSPIVSAGFQRGKKYTRRSEKIEAVIVLEDHVRGMARNEVPACLLGSSTELVCLCDVSILRVSDLILWPMTTPNGMQLLFSQIAARTVVRGSRSFHRSSISMYDYIHTENAFFRSLDFPILGYLFFSESMCLLQTSPGYFESLQAASLNNGIRCRVATSPNPITTFVVDQTSGSRK